MKKIIAKLKQNKKSIAKTFIKLSTVFAYMVLGGSLSMIAELGFCFCYDCRVFYELVIEALAVIILGEYFLKEISKK